MKYVYLNDCSCEVTVHTGSTTNKRSLLPGERIVIEIPEGAVPFIKTCDDGVVLLSYIEKGSYE